MEHGHHIGEVGLVIAYKKNIVLREVANNLGPLDFQGIESFIALVRHHTGYSN